MKLQLHHKENIGEKTSSSLSKTLAKIRIKRLRISKQTQIIILGVLLLLFLVEIFGIKSLYYATLMTINKKNESTTTKQQANTVPFYIITQNTSQNEYGIKENLIIKDADTWQKTWNAIHAKYKSPPALPEIDFKQYIVIGIFAGTQSTGEYSLVVNQILKKDTGLLILQNYTVPDKSCITIHTQTTPYEIIKIAKTDKPIQFQQTTIQSTCQKKYHKFSLNDLEFYLNDS